ncbi:flavin reductase family protein [Marinicella litoralis]|uniref:Ferredoxin-NADP reductase n=1 Tax=Marinicella litoralis TaxID=644220 RepID=A0A4R6XIS4_9GAMM|nr:FAD-binding oxidoreductase [Marinicella litoralis]TDR19372.1 ferredoxin-NADP reductase [Marinicella litoralis]
MSTPTSFSRHKKWVTQALTNHQSFKAYIEPLVQMVKPSWQASDCNAEVMDLRNESEQVYSLVLKPSKKWMRHTAGQYVHIQVTIEGVRYNRTFSVSSSPKHHEVSGLIELTIRKQEHGKVTQWMAQGLKVGDHISLTQAQGEFTLPNHQEPLLLIAGGSGITPFRSFLQQLAASHSTSDVHLIYYNQSIAPLFAIEWQQLSQAHPNFKISLIDTQISGLISAQQLHKTCPDFDQRKAYLCGPHGLITTCRDLLIEHGVAKTDIYHELFGPKPVSKPPSITNQNQASTVTFAQSNRLVNAQSQQSLLELAEAAELNPPSGCRMGICHQCKCSKKQGVVYNTLTNTYSDTGTEDIQLCVSIAVGDVTLDF